MPPTRRQVTKQSTKVNTNSVNSTTKTNTWLFLSKDDAFKSSENEEETPSIVKLRHPTTDKPALFLFSATNETIHQVNTFSEGKKSWFIDDSVVSNGKLHISTPIDPIFLVIPYLQKHCITKAIPLDHILMDDDYPEISRLSNLSSLKMLKLVADQKGDVELNAYKYNEEKTLWWLQKKTERVSEVLKQKNIHTSGGATSATFIKSNKDQQPDSSYLRYAHGIVSEYLTSDLSEKLMKHLNIPEEAKPQNKRKSVVNTDSQDNKKIKMENEKENEVKEEVMEIPKLENKLKQPTVSSKEKARAKAAAGTKSISSFFAKK